MRRAFIAFLLALVVSPVCAESFRSQEFGFSVDFPTPPAQQPAQDGPRGTDGTPVSTITAFVSGRKDAYAAVIAVETFNTRPTDDRRTLEAERDGFLNGMHMKSRSTFTELASYPALQFTFEAEDGTTHGRGLVLLVAKAQEDARTGIGALGGQAGRNLDRRPTQQARAYVVVYYSVNAGVTTAESEALDRYFDSFQPID